ncbi:MAG: hypothetical protein RR942_13825 [Romboutsia sp.]
MKELRCINFDNDVEVNFEDEFTYVNITIGNKEYGIKIDENETNREVKRHINLADCQFTTVEAIVALKKLTKFLESSIGIDFSMNLTE